MANIFVKLEDEARSTWDHFKEDMKVDHAQDSEEQFTLPEMENVKDYNECAKKMLSAMLETLTLTSPTKSVVAEIVKHPDHISIVMANDFGIIVQNEDSSLLNSLKILVNKAENVEVGQGLIQFNQNALATSRFFMMANVKTYSYEEEPEENLRILGPFVPQA